MAGVPSSDIPYGHPELVKRLHCDQCDQWVRDIGPWCKLYCKEQWCEPVRRYRRAVLDADKVGDGALVNGLCWYIREICGDDFVP